ncbi:sensor histidine kinase [Actinomadura vinacea]|uniref:Sensor histidine kinase n=1 Tax=Actinomadura vinacea TaxID=115336 RepID=A0ABN3IGF8_9ACTN
MTSRPGTVTDGAFAHPALFYRGRDEFLAGTVPFVLAGPDSGEPVAVAVPGPRLALLRDAVRAASGSTAARVTWIDMSEAGRNPGRIIPGVLRAFSDRHSAARVRIIGEPIWPGRSPAEYPACVQHEALINFAFAGREATVLCPYDTAGLDEDTVADARATHPSIVDGDGERHSAEYAPGRVFQDWNRPLPVPPGIEATPFDLDSIPAIRALAVRRGAALGLGAARAGDLELAVNELAANSALHGGGTGVLRIWTEDGHVVCEIRDAGLLTDPLVGRRPAGMSTEGGRGVLMVNHLADLVRVHTGPKGTTFRVYMRLRSGT